MGTSGAFIPLSYHSRASHAWLHSCVVDQTFRVLPAQPLVQLDHGPESEESDGRGPNGRRPDHAQPRSVSTPISSTSPSSSSRCSYPCASLSASLPHAATG